MAKTVSVDELTYSVVVATAGKLMVLFGKPFSLGLTIYMGANALGTMLDALTPEVTKQLKDAFEQFTPEDIEMFLEQGFRAITKGQK